MSNEKTPAEGAQASPETPPAGGQTPAQNPDNKGNSGNVLDAKNGDQNANPPENAAPVVPDKYDLKLPDGTALTQADVDEISSYAKEKKLTNEQAQELLEREHKIVNKFSENQKVQFEAKRDEWYKAAEGDKEIGGTQFKESAENAKRALERFGSDSLKQFLRETPWGNHPELIRTFARIGKAMSNDKFVQPGAQAAPQNKRAADILYDKTQT